MYIHMYLDMYAHTVPLYLFKHFPDISLEVLSKPSKQTNKDKNT